jgi:hypothetical protein
VAPQLGGGSYYVEMGWQVQSGKPCFSEWAWFIS